MPAFAAYAPGKVILFGEHAVVYDRPAIAVPVTEVQARAMVRADLAAPAGRIWMEAPDTGLDDDLGNLPPEHPFAILLGAVGTALGLPRFPALRLHVTSSIPIAAGMGSGAAISVAAARALAAFVGRPLSDEQASQAAFEVEKAYHGTPSGIDNTVIAYGKPILFHRNQPFHILRPGKAFTLVIADTGLAVPTREVVGDLRRRWEESPIPYEQIFDAIASLVRQARTHIENGEVEALGILMNNNHHLLQQLGVSCPQLDRLVDAAREAGALGAKLCGAGRGGNMIALVTVDTAPSISETLKAAGAVRIITTTISAGEG